MPTERRDYIVRLIEQLAAAIGGLRARIGKGGGEVPLVLKEAQEAQAALLGSMAATLPLLDASTAAMILRDRKQVLVWADYIRLEAEARRALGEADEADVLEARAGELERAAGPES